MQVLSSCLASFRTSCARSNLDAKFVVGRCARVYLLRLQLFADACPSLTQGMTWCRELGQAKALACPSVSISLTIVVGTLPSRTAQFYVLLLLAAPTHRPAAYMCVASK